MQGCIFPYCKVDCITYPTDETILRNPRIPDVESREAGGTIAIVLCRDMLVIFLSLYKTQTTIQTTSSPVIYFIQDTRQNISATGKYLNCDCTKMKGISLVIIYTSCISVSKTQDIDLDGEVSGKVELG